jgi:hypothetical protein
LNEPFPSSAASFSNYHALAAATQQETCLLDCSLVNTPAFVDKMSCCGGLARVDVADDNAKHTD